MIAEPPLEAGAVQVTVAWAFPAVARTAVGASGAPTGVTADEAAEAALEATELLSLTVK